MRHALLAPLVLAAAGCALLRGGDERAIRTEDGVRIVYEVVAPEDPAASTLVFLHCWSGDRGYWSEQLREFGDTHRCIAVDLAGHGDSGAERSVWTLDRLAQDVALVLDEEDARDAVLIGHSMSGPIALAVARLRPERVRAVVGVDTMHDASLREPAEPIAHVTSLPPEEYREAVRDFVRGMFPPGADPALVERVANDMAAGDVEVGKALLRLFPEYRLDEALAATAVPVRLINAEHSREPTQVAVNRRYAADFDAVLLQDTGHFPQLDRPQAFNAALRGVLSSLPE